MTGIRLRLSAGMGVALSMVVGLANPPPAIADQPPTARAQVQHLLRRLAFSASPATVSAVAAAGSDVWLRAQLTPSGIDDSAAIASLEPEPTTTNPDGTIPNEFAYERRFIQRAVRSLRQVQMKLVLHWIDHFAIGDEKVHDQAMMSRYETVLRNGGLGNFEQLVAAVAAEPAMLIWLDNDGNAAPIPNENFARELMQIYLMGVDRLNADGSVIPGPNGNPLPNYSQADVQQVALAMTGFNVVWNDSDPNPNTGFAVSFDPRSHYPGARQIMGQTVQVPSNATCMTAIIHFLVRQPSVAPFQVRELLQRFVTEAPSPRYIADIVQVWNAHLDDPNQLANVLWAIAHHPEFNTTYRSMPKQPVELVLGALRQLPGVLRPSVGQGPGDDLVSGGWLTLLGQEPYFPPSVFSFYRPGQLSSLTNTNLVLQRTGTFTDVAGSKPSDDTANVLIDIQALRTRVGSTAGPKIAAYLLDALVDGGTPALQQTMASYLGAKPDDDQLRGALWLLLNSPSYAVN
ncbi:MAG TPA: DUF1800 family protein [Aliidongia sp.]|uniref:DUF1800 domain-containing protein n=1 Tax=Aliidongia sp. TaxID=1914230 RepID=UPI002DDD8047|nr:DUF1800 family protein [Aliidongia sp.]HEV2675947.1 DUF1800 family protein [Aliidongia sp.]